MYSYGEECQVVFIGEIRWRETIVPWQGFWLAAFVQARFGNGAFNAVLPRVHRVLLETPVVMQCTRWN